MSDITTVDTSYVDNSSCFRYILGDENVCARIIITGLSYNASELCRVFNILLNENDIEDINIYKRSRIDFNRGKITDKQIEHIRDASNGLQKTLINKLYEKTEIKKEGKDYDRFNEFSEKLRVKIIVYDINKNILFKTDEGVYDINVLKNNEQYYTISNIDRFKPKCMEGIKAGEKKKKIPPIDILIENNNTNTPKTYNEQVEIIKKLKSQPFGDDVVRELFSSVSIDTFINYKDDDDFDPNRIKEWEYAISCSKCHTGDCFKCDGYKMLKSNVRYYVRKHKCFNYKGTRLVSKCTKCNMYIFSAFKHTCKNNRIAKRYSYLDNVFSIYINERVGQTPDHTTD